MKIEHVAELARTVAALPKPERDFFDGMVADERAKAADAARIFELRAMPDSQVIALAVKAGKSAGEFLRATSAQGVDVDEVTRVLRDAGFVRGDIKQLHEAREALERVVRLIVDAASQFPVRYDYAELNRLIMQAATALSEVEAGRA